MKIWHWLTFLLSLIVLSVHADPLDREVQKILTKHYEQYKDQEYFSGIALALYETNHIKNYYIGNLSHAADSPKITDQTLFQIGSITKSFTAAILLQLQKEKLLTLDMRVNEFLSAYPKWGNLTLRSLLNMTSGLPNYTDSPLINALEFKNPTRIWKNEELIQFAYPKATFSPPLKTGYFYTNTGYILLDMIINKVTNHSFKDELIKRLIIPIQLTNTIYPVPFLENASRRRLAHGYYYNQYDNAAWVGADLINNNLSWAAAAGGIVANAEDIIKWVKSIFIDETVLDAVQKKELMALISTKTGNPIANTTASDPEGFGLGVAERFDAKHSPLHMWFFEGETLGFRALYIYVPCNKVIVAAIFNSATNAENDHAKDLVNNIYHLILNEHKALSCHA